MTTDYAQLQRLPQQMATVPFADYHRLVLELLALKREGFVIPPAHGEPAKSAELPAAIQRAITDLGVDKSTERHLTIQAWELIRADVEETEIVRRITDGEEATL